MAQVLIPTPLRTYTRGQKSVTVPAGTVEEALTALTGTYPDLKRHLYTEDGHLRNFVNIYLGDEDIRQLRQGATSLRENDTLSIVPSIAGGSASETLKADRVLDCRGLLCPMPVVRIAQDIKAVDVGQTIELLTTDRGSKADIAAWGKQTGQDVLDVQEVDGVFHFFVRRTK